MCFLGFQTSTELTRWTLSGKTETREGNCFTKRSKQGNRSWVVFFRVQGNNMEKSLENASYIVPSRLSCAFNSHFKLFCCCCHKGGCYCQCWKDFICVNSGLDSNLWPSGLSFRTLYHWAMKDLSSFDMHWFCYFILQALMVKLETAENKASNLDIEVTMVII